jgi:hypothetical protein
MGAGNSKSKKKSTNEDIDYSKDPETENMKIENVIDYVATKYITQSDFTELQNLHKAEYCNKLVILTSKVIKQFLNDIDIEYLNQRTKDGLEINKMDKERVLYLAKGHINRLDISNSIRKKRMCIGIAKFYVKIAHLFAAITMTINPRYIYTDLSGVEQNISIFDKAKIPKHLKQSAKYKSTNICSSRINTLKPVQNTSNGISVKGKNCNINKKIKSKIDDVNVPIHIEKDKYLDDEPGISELELLYFDKYNFNDGLYYGMTENAQKDYQSDLELFYKVFTGEKSIPPKKDENGKILKDKNGKPIPSITKFSQIPLKAFHKQELCKDPNSPWTKIYRGKPSDKLFKDYAEHLKTMISKSQEREHALLKIIKEIFSFWIDPQKKEKILTINPKLNNEFLQELVVKTRKIIIDLYINCEKDFQKGLSIYEAIVKSKMLITHQRRIEQFEKKADNLQDGKIEKSAEVPVEKKSDEVVPTEVVPTEIIPNDAVPRAEIPNNPSTVSPEKQPQNIQMDITEKEPVQIQSQYEDDEGNLMHSPI